MQVRHFFSLKHFETFDRSHTFLSPIVAKLSTIKQVQFLLDHPVCIVFYLYSSEGATYLTLYCRIGELQIFPTPSFSTLVRVSLFKLMEKLYGS